MHAVHLTDREQETLHAVARRLTNTEIAEQLGISIRTVESHIAALRRKLMAESRRELIDAAQLYLGRPVPAAVDSFVGREADLTSVAALLRRERWVTVTGPAGVGKTRLATELARRRPSVVVPLEHAEPGGALRAIASALGLERAEPGSMLDACVVALSGDLLLVLDDADRVATEVAGTVRTLLARVDGLRVVTTSQTAVRGAGEVVVELAGLPSDRPGDPAVRLFGDRARAASRDVDLSDAELVGGLCRRLEGMPLSIELAASLVRHMPLPELDRRLAEGFSALGTASGAATPAEGPTTVAGRHAALGSAFAWTWDLLTPDLRDVLGHLAALPRTFDLELAAATVGRVVDHEVVELLGRSLLAREPDGPGPQRYRVPAALREFVAARTPPPVANAVAARHARHHSALARAIAATARTDDGPAAQARVHQLCPEVSAALVWAVHAGDPVATDLAEAVGTAIEQYGPEPGMAHALAYAAADVRVRSTWDAPVLGLVGRALVFTHLDLVGHLAARATEVADGRGPAERLASEQLVARHLAYRGRSDEALEHLDVAARLADQLGDVWERAAVDQLMGSALLRRDPPDHRAALEALDRARRGYAAAGDTMHVVNVRYMMASAAAEVADEELRRRAAGWADRCVAYAEEHRNVVEIGHARLARAQLVVVGREHDLQVAEQMFRRSGDLRCLSRALVALAGARAAEAGPLLREAVAVGEASGDVLVHRAAAAGLARWLWEHGRQDEAAAVLGPVTRLLGVAGLAGLVPDGLVEELAT